MNRDPRFAELDRLIAAEGWRTRCRKPCNAITSIPDGAVRVARVDGKPQRQPVMRLSQQARTERRQVRDALAYRPDTKDRALELRISESEGRVEHMRVEQALREAGKIL